MKAFIIIFSFVLLLFCVGLAHGEGNTGINGVDAVQLNNMNQAQRDAFIAAAAKLQQKTSSFSSDNIPLFTSLLARNL